jgi:RNA polymerase sigma-70 factor (ECF subfamily)
MKNTTTTYQAVTPVSHSLLHISYAVSDATLLILDTKREIFTKAYEEHSRPLFKFCLYKLSNKEKAKDLVSDTFFRAWQYIERGNHIENEKSFLYTTARHLIIDEYRKKKCMSLDQLVASGFEISQTSEQEIYNHIDGVMLLKEINKLPKGYNEIITMRYINDCSVRDIAKALKNTENNISVKIHRGVGKLRVLLLNQG